MLSHFPYDKHTILTMIRRQAFWSSGALLLSLTAVVGPETLPTSGPVVPSSPSPASSAAATSFRLPAAFHPCVTAAGLQVSAKNV